VSFTQGVCDEPQNTEQGMMNVEVPTTSAKLLTSKFLVRYSIFEKPENAK